ncbi:hypothetical protein BS50DRAFT_621491 [Corynespora cassiicola Philippines]|uniref:Uncharacterized protein n=1 Tax=Corynespora cassiicola Philippines TaxID=1448308 RepID=A0A2T2NQG6_CORCC|nr:hypothetical protein BS50DRAFT_621491 [Corynespora cassiicola Philippines]
MTESTPNSALLSCLRTTAKFYVCTNQSKFLGCCDVDPCANGCPQESISPTYFDQDSYGRFPDASCGKGSNFFGCTPGQSFTYYGCCKSNPCANSGICPAEDVAPAYIDRPEQIAFYTNSSLMTDNYPPLTTSAVAVATGLPSYTPSVQKQLRIGPSVARVSIGTSGLMIVVLSVVLVTWIIYRNIISSMRLVSHNERHNRDETTSVSLSTKGYAPMDIDQTSTSKKSKEIFRLGKKTLYVLLGTSLTILGVCGFLAFLWFGRPTNTTWSRIMINGWATRAVSLSALILRTSIDFQAAIATAILASLLLENAVGTHAYHLASISPMRDCTSNPFSFAYSLMMETWHSAKRYRRHYIEGILASVLVITTILMQFTSTFLLSDLQSGPLKGRQSNTQIRTGLSFVNKSNKISRTGTWTSSPPFYPVFGEYHEITPQTDKSMADTGFLLRTLIPYSVAESRQTLSTYAGNALVLDARVTCHAPSIQDLNNVTGHYNQLQGTASISEGASPFPGMLDYPFNCTVTGPGIITLCQIAPTYNDTGRRSTSSFEGSTSYSTVFLVIRPETSASDGWLDMPLGVWKNPTSFSLCFAPWDASILDVSLSSPQNRTEPQIQWWKTFNTSTLLSQLIPSPSSSPERPILTMQKPRSLRGDLPPDSERPFLQSDASTSLATESRVNYPLAGNWSVLLTQRPVLLMLQTFQTDQSRIVSADPAVSAIFSDALAAGHSVAWALSSVITVLSSVNYYNQQPAFDRLDDAAVSFFETVLYPRNYVGLVVVLWTLVVHFGVLAGLLVLFVTQTRLTLLGNAWAAFVQMAGSGELRGFVDGASFKTDEDVLEGFREGRGGGLRARVVAKSGGAEVVIR